MAERTGEIGEPCRRPIAAPCPFTLMMTLRSRMKLYIHLTRLFEPHVAHLSKGAATGHAGEGCRDVDEEGARNPVPHLLSLNDHYRYCINSCSAGSASVLSRVEALGHSTVCSDEHGRHLFENLPKQLRRKLTR